MLGMSLGEYLLVFWIGFPFGLRMCMKGQEEMLYSTEQYFWLICSSFFHLFSSTHKSDNSKQRFINYFTCVHRYCTQVHVNACYIYMRNVKEENIFLVAITKRFHYS